MDRGGAIQVLWEWLLGKFTETIWLDLLTPVPPVPYGTILDVEVNTLSSDTSIDNSNTGSGYQEAYYIPPQRGWKKVVFRWLKYWDLISPEVFADYNLPTPKEEIPQPEPAEDVGCENTSTPCLFPLEKGIEAYITGTTANNGLDCHTSGGPLTIQGWDYWTPEKSSGSVIYATHDGYVDWAGYDGIGNSIIQISNDQWLTTSMHMETFYVETGQKVYQGLPIGRMGSVGNSSWPHLHYAIYQKGVGPVCDQKSIFK
jgi:hypothetical protein